MTNKAHIYLGYFGDSAARGRWPRKAPFKDHSTRWKAVISNIHPFLTPFIRKDIRIKPIGLRWLIDEIFFLKTERSPPGGVSQRENMDALQDGANWPQTINERFLSKMFKDYTSLAFWQHESSAFAKFVSTLSVDLNGSQYLQLSVWCQISVFNKHGEPPEKPSWIWSQVSEKERRNILWKENCK